MTFTSEFWKRNEILENKLLISVNDSFNHLI